MIAILLLLMASHPLTTKLAVLGVTLQLAVVEIVNEAADAANKVGTLGMQGLLAFMLIILGVVIWFLEKKRTLEREARDKVTIEQYNNLLTHHQTFARKAEEERAGFHLEMKAHAAELRGLTERSIVAMHAMATSTDALREWLKDRPAIAHSPRHLEEREG